MILQREILMKIFLALTLFLISAASFAKIPQGCKPNLDDLVQSHKDFEKRAPKLLASGELDKEDVELLRQDERLVADSVADLCAGLRLIELERSVQNRLGLLSRVKAEREAKRTYSEAMDYYEEAIK